MRTCLSLRNKEHIFPTNTNLIKTITEIMIKFNDGVNDLSQDGVSLRALDHAGCKY